MLMNATPMLTAMTLKSPMCRSVFDPGALGGAVSYMTEIAE